MRAGRPALVLAALALAAATGCASQPAAPPADSGATDDRTTYEIVYEVREAGIATPREERIAVRRPYLAHARSTRQGQVVAETVQSADRLTVTTGQGETVLPRPPGPPGVDLRLEALADAVRLGLAELDGRGEVAGRACRWHLTRQPLDAGPFEPPASGERTRSCVDAAGMLMAEQWTLDGTLLRSRTAVLLEQGVRLEIKEPVGEVQRLPGALDVRAMAAPGPGLVLTPPDPPSGHRLAHVVELVQHDAADPLRPLARGQRWVYDDGVRVRWIEQRQTLRGSVSEPLGRPHPLPSAADARLEIGGAGAVLRWVVDDVLVEVGGTTSLEVLTEWIATLEPAS